jgi:hypothetical protein
MRLSFSHCLILSVVSLALACQEGTIEPNDPSGAAGNAGNGGADSGGATSGAKAGSGTVTGGATQSSGGAGGASTASGGETSGGSTSTYSTEGCTAVPVNPNATQQARNLLCYLHSINGKSVLSGQQETSWQWGLTAPNVDVDWIKTQTGKYPAVLGGDYLYPGDTGKNNAGTTDRAKTWWNAGGLPMIRYHMGAPPLEDTYENSKGSVADLDNVVKEGTTENTSFKKKLDYVSKELTTLQSAGVAVLWAPLHEVQPNGWFWWSKGTGAQFVAIWKYLFDYMTKTKGLNNLVWLLPFSGSPNAAYYPGKDYVDIAGPDTYDMTSQPFASMFKTTRAIVGDGLPIPLHETGKIPNPDTMFPTTAPWVLFNVWCGYEKDSAKNTVAEVKAAYESSYTITRDELPNLK